MGVENSVYLSFLWSPSYKPSIFLLKWSYLFAFLSLLLSCELLGNPGWQCVTLVSSLSNHNPMASFTTWSQPFFFPGPGYSLLILLTSLFQWLWTPCHLWKKSSLICLISLAFVEKKWIKWTQWTAPSVGTILLWVCISECVCVYVCLRKNRS